MLAKYLIFIKAHEKLLIFVLAGLLAFHFYGSALNAWIHHDDAQTVLAQQTLAVQQQKDAALEQQNAVLQSQLTSLIAQVASIKNQRVVAQTQVAKVPDNQLQSDIESKMGGPLTSPVVLRKIDDTITDYPLVLKEVDALQAEILTGTNLQNGLNANIIGLKAELADKDKLWQGKLDTANDKAKRNLLRGFKFGFVAGFVTGVAAGHYL